MSHHCLTTSCNAAGDAPVKLHYLPSTFKEPTRRLRAAKGAAASAAGAHSLEDAAAGAAAAGAMLGAAAAKLGTPEKKLDTPTGGDAATCCAALGGAKEAKH